jgi:hypothetical protein
LELEESLAKAKPVNVIHRTIFHCIPILILKATNNWVDNPYLHSSNNLLVLLVWPLQLVLQSPFTESAIIVENLATKVLRVHRRDKIFASIAVNLDIMMIIVGHKIIPSAAIIMVGIEINNTIRRQRTDFIIGMPKVILLIITLQQIGSHLNRLEMLLLRKVVNG